MIPVDQLVKHDPETGAVGDCMRAAIASLLEMWAADVPHFCVLADKEWYVPLGAWLKQFDLAYMEFDVEGEDAIRAWEASFQNCAIDTHHLIIGTSPRFPDELHVVVGRNGKAVHDPHPDKTGLAGPPKAYGFLIRRCGP